MSLDTHDLISSSHFGNLTHGGTIDQSNCLEVSNLITILLWKISHENVETQWPNSECVNQLNQSINQSINELRVEMILPFHSKLACHF